MIKIIFYKKNNQFVGFDVSGHANYADFGDDIVCAGVSSATIMAANTISEIIKIENAVFVKQNSIIVDTKQTINNIEQEKEIQLDVIYHGLYLHLNELSIDYKDNITIEVMEV